MIFFFECCCAKSFRIALYEILAKCGGMREDGCGFTVREKYSSICHISLPACNFPSPTSPQLTLHFEIHSYKLCNVLSLVHAFQYQCSAICFFSRATTSPIWFAILPMIFLYKKERFAVFMLFYSPWLPPLTFPPPLPFWEYEYFISASYDLSLTKISLDIYY